MPSPIQASCHCGVVRLELDPPTLMCSHCHCTSCRQIHAAAFVTWTGAAVDRFRIVQGEELLVRYASTPPVTRAFCGTCGTHVLYTHREMPDKVYVPVGVLRTPLDRRAESHVNVAEAVPWCGLPLDGLPRFEGFD